MNFPVSCGRPFEVDPAPVSPGVVGCNAHERQDGCRLSPGVELCQKLVSPAPFAADATVRAVDTAVGASAEPRVLGPNLALVVRNLIAQVKTAEQNMR